MNKMTLLTTHFPLQYQCLYAIYVVLLSISIVYVMSIPTYTASPQVCKTYKTCTHVASFRHNKAKIN